MYDTATHHKFIELRAQDWSLARIAVEIQVAKCTLIEWERRFQQEIADLKIVELEALQERHLASHEEELSRLAGHLNRVEAVLSKRRLDVISTEFLFYMAGALRSQIKKQRLPIVFSPPPSRAQPGTRSGEVPGGPGAPPDQQPPTQPLPPQP